MKIEISKFLGKIFLDLQDNRGIYTSILALSKKGVAKIFIANSTSLSIKGYYIADEDSN